MILFLTLPSVPAVTTPDISRDHDAEGGVPGPRASVYTDPAAAVADVDRVVDDVTEAAMIAASHAAYISRNDVDGLLGG